MLFGALMIHYGDAITVDETGHNLYQLGVIGICKQSTEDSGTSNEYVFALKLCHLIMFSYTYYPEVLPDTCIWNVGPIMISSV